MTKKEREKRNDNIIDLWIRGNELNWIAFTHNLHKNRVKAVIRKFIEEYERWREEKRNENTPRISAPDKRNARGDIRKTIENLELLPKAEHTRKYHSGKQNARVS